MSSLSPARHSEISLCPSEESLDDGQNNKGYSEDAVLPSGLSANSKDLKEEENEKMDNLNMTSGEAEGKGELKEHIIKHSSTHPKSVDSGLKETIVNKSPLTEESFVNNSFAPESQNRNGNHRADMQPEETPIIKGNEALRGKIVPSSTPNGETENVHRSPGNDNDGNWKTMRVVSSDRVKRPFMQKHNPLPPDPTVGERFKHSFTCPPHGKIGMFLTYTLLFALFWGSLVYITREQALPGGTLFSLLVLVVVAQIAGLLVAKLRLPPLLGMLLVGIIFRSVPGVDIIGRSIETSWSSSLRSTALVVILIRAGLGLDPDALRKLSFVVLRLAMMPCLVEASTVAVISHFLLEFPWKWGFLLGFVLAAVSPAVVVPCLLNLSEQGYGVEKGIPTLVIAAASIDDVLAISGFGICLGLIYSEGSAVWQGLKGPLEFGMGIFYGIIIGCILWVLPNKKHPNAIQLRVALLLCAGLLAVFGSKGIDFGGAGALACLCVAFVAGYGWKKQGKIPNKMQVNEYFNLMWMFFQPMLFGLIGTEIRISDLQMSTVGWGVVTLLAGLTLRVFVSFFAVLGGDLNIRERFFVALAWLPKATVQAAIGSTALDYARDANRDSLVESVDEIFGAKVLTIAVLVILITAPIGAVAIMLSAPKLLKKAPPKKEIEMEKNGDVES